MLIVYRNGQRVLLTGWRAWLILVPAVVLSSLALVALGGLFLGIAFTAASFFLVGLPVAILLAFLVQFFQSRVR